MKHTVPIRLYIVLSALAFGFTSCHQFFQGKIDMTQKNGSATLTDLLSDPKPITQIDKPAQIFVSHGKNADAVKIHIAWSAVTEAASYRLERAVVQAKEDGTFPLPDESEFKIIKSSGTNPITSSYITGTSYTDVILNSESAKYSDKEYTYGYFYRVSAENAYKKYDPSAFTESTAGTLFAPPRSPRASIGDSENYIMFTWEKSDSVSYYRIYRSENRDGTNSLYLGRVAANQNQYKDTIPSSQQGKEYYYTVYAQNAAGNISVASAPALGFTLIAGAPPKVQNVRVTDGRGTAVDHITITWDPSSGTDITYAVYRTSSVDSAYLLCSNTVTQTSYTDTQSLKPNVYYYYQVQAIKTVVNSDGTTTVTKGPFSASSPTDAQPAEAYLLSPPASLDVSKVSGSSPAKVLFRFPAALGAPDCLANSNFYHDYNAYTYRLFGGTTPDTVNTEIPVSMPAAINGYYEVEADPGSHKFFTVATVNGTQQSAASTVAAPAPYEAKDVTATQHKTIAGVTDNAGNANSSGVYPVRITWSAPDEGADGGYYIYRSTQKTNGFRRITEMPVTELSYIDKNDTAKTGTYYYYKVLSLNSLLQGINFTDAVCGYGALTYDQYFREYNKTIKRSHQKLTLMHKPGTSALGSETVQGDIGGKVQYEAKMSGFGARITMYYNGYCDYYISGSVQLGIYFTLTGNTNTSANISANGSMDGTVTCTGMYPGTIVYDNIEIKGGNAGGGHYVVKPEGFPAGNVSYAIGLE